MNQTAYESIRSKIIEGSFKPGEALPEESLSRKLNVSRTPVREALIRLQSEGLVKIIRNRGAFVREISFKDIAEIFEMRILLEGYASYSCIGHIDVKKIEKLRSQLENMLDNKYSLQKISHLGMQLHYLIRDYCGNSRLQNFISTIDSQILWVRSFAYRIPGRTIKSLIEHIALANALIDGDKEKSKEKMTQHLKNTLAEILDVGNVFVDAEKF
jgi:DNA-binding GntR family transcriptional regulator